MLLPTAIALFKNYSSLLLLIIWPLFKLPSRSGAVPAGTSIDRRWLEASGLASTLAFGRRGLADFYAEALPAPLGALAPPLREWSKLKAL